MSTHPDTPNDLDTWPASYRYLCCGAWWEDGCQCEDAGVLGIGLGSAAVSDESGFWPTLHNDDRMEDVEAGHPMRDSTYTDDGA